MSDMPGGPTPPPPPPPAGTPPGPGGLRPRTLGEILSAAFQIYKDNLGKLVLIVAVVVVPLSLIGAVVGEAVAGDETTVEVFGESQTVSDRTFVAVVAGLLVAALIAVIISAVLQAAMMRAAALATIGDPVDVEASYRWGFKRFGSVILVGLLVGIVIVVGFLLLIIPGIIFLTLLSVSIPALVIENRRGTEAMKRSWELASGNFWHVLGVIVVAFLITSFVSSLIGSIGGDNWFVAWIFSAIAQIVVAPFSALVSVLLYLDLRARKEALTADSLRTELASNV